DRPERAAPEPAIALVTTPNLREQVPPSEPQLDELRPDRQRWHMVDRVCRDSAVHAGVLLMTERRIQPRVFPAGIRTELLPRSDGRERLLTGGADNVGGAFSTSYGHERVPTHWNAF